MKILTVVGARPQFIKAAMVSRAVLKHNRSDCRPIIMEEIIHTGQHYDRNMSDIFFQEMGIPEPRINLQVGSGMHGEMTGRMLARIEQVVVERKPDWVLVYGDTNSTLAAALAAAKLHVPVAHVEAGLRSFNKRMPEEINRILTDHMASLLLCPTREALKNLEREGISRGVHHVGDVMYDAAIVFGEIAESRSAIIQNLKLSRGEYLLATVHRAENTEDPDRLKNILDAFAAFSLPVVFPIHPRTRKKIEEVDFASFIESKNSIKIIDPVSFLDMVQLEKNARCILTDSGGVQKEAYFHGVPCVTLRDETEWVETVDAGWNRIVGAETEKIIEAVERAKSGTSISEYGEGKSAERVLSLLCDHIGGCVYPNETPMVL